MDVAARAGIGRSFSGGINVAFISIRSFFFEELHAPSPSLHAILAFLAPVLLDFLQLQYQGKVVSPFETHPKTTWVALAGLLMYCLAYDFELRCSATHSTPAYAQIVSRVKVLSGSVSLVSLASILFPESVRMVLYLVYTLFLASQVELLRCRLQMLWDWLHQRTISNLPREMPGQDRRMSLALTNRRLMTPASVWNWLHQRMISNLPQEMPVQERRTRRALINWPWFITPASVWNWLHQRMINNLPQAMPVQERRTRLALINRPWFMTPASVNRGPLLPL